MGKPEGTPHTGFRESFGTESIEPGMRKNAEAFVALTDSTLKKIKASKRGLLISGISFSFPCFLSLWSNKKREESGEVRRRCRLGDGQISISPLCVLSALKIGGWRVGGTVVERKED